MKRKTTSIQRLNQAARLRSIEDDSYLRDLLQNITHGRDTISLRKGKKIYSQGDRADAIYFIQSGRVKIAVVSATGKEAVIAVRGPHDSLGEGSLVGQSRQVTTATALDAVTVFRIEKQAMLKALRDQSGLAQKFIELLVVRNIKLEEDLSDQLFNHSERRLARVLLKLAALTRQVSVRDAKVPRLSHQTLAEMVGTTRPRVTQFMNKFRRLGLLEYNGELTVKPELVADLVLRD